MSDPNFTRDEPGASAVLLATIVTVVIQTIGYGAATYSATREAAGLQVKLGDALRYGARRCLGLIGTPLPRQWQPTGQAW